MSAGQPIPQPYSSHRFDPFGLTSAVGRRETVRVGRWRIHYQVAGPSDGPPVVLVHGLAASWTWWADTVPALAARYRVYAVDLPGFGHTSPRRPFAINTAVLMLARWAGALRLPPATFVGHSMGGHICIHLAAQHPALVRRLVLVNATGLPLNSRLPLLVINALRSGSLEPPGFFWRVVISSLRAGPLVLASAARALLRDDASGALSRIHVPTLVVWGDRDRLVPLPLGIALAQAIADARLEVIPGAGHKTMMERSDQFNAALLRFLAEAGQPKPHVAPLADV